jgi:hypothetical protein
LHRTPDTLWGTQAAAAGQLPPQDWTISRRLTAAQKKKEYRAALAFALAFDRLVPEPRRPRLVPLSAPCVNDGLVPSFTEELLTNPLTPEVRAEKPSAVGLRIV